jgi:hypothetical protein
MENTQQQTKTVEINGVWTPFDYHGCIHPNYAAKFGYRLIHKGSTFKDENGKTVKCPSEFVNFHFYVKTN